MKVLDFGLAKAMDGGNATNSALSQSPTMSRHMTEMGMIIGTAAYMSPEQARGKAVDRRADIWAFGVVLYEMMSGQRLFKGEDVSDTLAAVLRQDVDFSALPKDAPPRRAPSRRAMSRSRSQAALARHRRSPRPAREPRVASGERSVDPADTTKSGSPRTRSAWRFRGWVRASSLSTSAVGSRAVSP